jgi:DNA (cytosine-5)-methyltransferase 1
MSLRIATDCSGIEAPIQALKRLGIPFDHIWSSDIDPNAQASIQANYHPQTLYTDIRERDPATLPPVDWYVAGFPCQAFSARGNMKGFEDDRGMLFFYILDTIKACSPTVFVLENVKGILSNDGGNTFKRITKELEELTEYELEVFLLNSKDFDSPQSRERVFFVGVKKSHLVHPFEFPKMVTERTHTLSDLLEEKVDASYFRDTEEYKRHHKVTTNQDFLYDTCNPKSGPKLDTTTTRCLLTSSRVFFSKIGRILTPREHLRLQGFSDDFKIVVSKTQAYKQAGNSMNVKALCALFTEIFRVMGKPI